MVVIHGVEVRTEIEELVDPSLCAVLVVDMVNEDVAPEGAMPNTGSTSRRIAQSSPLSAGYSNQPDAPISR
jgi:hypothetical protein